MTRRALVGVVVAAVAAAAYLVAHLELAPDYGLYARGGLGLYPSPLGRLLGATSLLWLVNASCAGWIAARLVDVGRWQLAVWAPVLVWIFPAGVDAIGASLAVSALLCRSTTRSGVLTIATVAVHPVAAIAPLAALLARRPLVTVPALAVVVALLACSPYGAALDLRGSSTAVIAALVTLAVGLAAQPRVRAPEGLLAVAVASAVYLAAQTDHGAGLAYARYSLPLVLYGLLRGPGGEAPGYLPPFEKPDGAGSIPALA